MPEPANLILFQSDNHNRDLLGCYGHPIVRTPNMDRIADGVLFRNAYCASGNSDFKVPNRVGITLADGYPRALWSGESGRDFRRFAEATGLVTRAEREGGGLVHASGWERKPGWTWRSPYGRAAGADEPAVHVTFDEAQAYCRWAGKRLPTDAEWVEAAYTESRAAPPPGFTPGRRYPFPTGESPLGANCLAECGDTAAIDYSAVLERGRGHARAGTTRDGVNGLFDMGANVWEWIDTGEEGYKGTRGGSWWYGAAQMRREHEAAKPRDMAVVYIGFRCVRDFE